MGKRYRVAAAWGDHAPGDEVAAADHPGVNFSALVQGGLMEEITSRTTCPACAADKRIKKPPSFEKQETLDEHYANEHPALSPPDIDEVLNGDEKRIP